MASTHPSFLRAFALAAALAVAGATLAASPAHADTLNPAPVSAQGLPTEQIDGVVWTQAVANGVDYLGGQFTSSRPAGAVAGTDETPRQNLLAIDVRTGAAMPGFHATTNGTVRALAAAPDGSRIYVAGDFTQVNGQPRSRIAALTPDGQLVSGFAPNPNTRVYSLAVTGSTVYFGGSFTQVDGSARPRAAAVDTSGRLLGWAPSVPDQSVRALAVSPDGAKVLLGGGFTALNGQALNGLGAVSATTGRSITWPASALSQNSGLNSAIFSLSSRNGLVVATGFAYRSTGNLEGAIAMRWSDGSDVWVDNCHGDTYSSVLFNDAVYTAGHAHDCSSIGGFAATEPATFHRAIAFSQAAGPTKVQGSGSYNPLYGRSAPNILDWYPDLAAGTYTGQSQAAWSVTASNGFLIYAGEFPKVNGVRQQGIVRFQGVDDGAGATVGSPQPVPTPTPTPTDPTVSPTPTTGVRPGKVTGVDAVALGPSKAAVRWTAPKGAKTSGLKSYVVKAYKGAKVVRSVTVGASKRMAVLSGLSRSTSYRIGVAAKNAHGQGALSKLDAVKTKAKGKNVSATKKPSKVGKPTATVGKARIRVKWKGASTKGALAVTSYQVRIVLHGKTVKTVKVDDRLRSRLVTGLKRHVSYSVSVRAVSWAGAASWSTGRSVRTR